MIYGRPSPEHALSQGDLVDDCPIFGLDSVQDPVDLDAEPTRWRVRVLVLTQACSA